VAGSRASSLKEEAMRLRSLAPHLSWQALAAALVLLLATTAVQAQTGAEGSAGYVENAVPATQFRLRFDAAYQDNRPDRAEFFWPGPPGPPLPETRVDWQEIRSYLELALGDRLSVFAEVPVRFVNPDINANAGGLSDVNAGFKLAVLRDAERCLSFQFRTFAPTGDGSRGLGTDHVTLEPALLLYRRLSDRLLLEGEFHDYIPAGGDDFTGNVLRAGGAFSYDVYRSHDCRIAPVAELVGWVVLSGKESVGLTDFVKDAAGDTIVNAKFGLRMGVGPRNDFYVGYGRALTGTVWYKDVLRLEYRLLF
jgi:hypothetical protein